MRRQSVFLALLLLLSGFGGTAGLAPPREGASPSSAKCKPSFVYLRDGGKLSCWPRLDAWSVETAYGALKIPTRDLLRVRFSRRWSQADLEKVGEAMKRLGSEDFDERESAMEALRKLGPVARDALRRGLKSEDPEVKTRSETLFAELGAAGPAEPSESDEGMEPLPAAGDDEIITVRFSIKGKILGESITVETLYGDLEVKFTDILGIGFHSDAQISATVTVAGTTTVPGSWVDTKCTFSRGDKISLRAGGTLTVSNYNLTVGPEGTTRYRTAGTPYSNFPTLALIGKIGKKGTPFLVGPKHESRARSEGTLYLGIVPFRRGYVAAGSFQVKIDGER